MTAQLPKLGVTDPGIPERDVTARTTPDDLPDLPDRNVASLAANDLTGTNAAAIKRGFLKMDRNQFTEFEEFPDSGNPYNFPNGFER